MFIRGFGGKNRFPPRGDCPVPYGSGRHIPKAFGIGSSWTKRAHVFSMKNRSIRKEANVVGIVGYGAYMPRNRIKVEEIAKVWGADAPSYKRGLMLEEKSVPSPDQDTITMSVEASKNALKRAGIDPQMIGAVYIGSESHPYAVKPSGTVVAEALGATPEVHTADFEFACKAGSEGMYVIISQVEAGHIPYGLAIGADTSQGAPGDALEYAASAGAAAFIFGTENIVASVDMTYAFMTDTPDFWRREYQYYPRHASRFTGEPAYFKHITGCAVGIMERAAARALRRSLWGRSSIRWSFV